MVRPPPDDGAPASASSRYDSQARSENMQHYSRNSAARLGMRAAALLLALVLGPPGRAADTDLDRFKAGIDAFVGRLGPTTNGVVKWAGSDLYEVRRDGDAFVAVIGNARLAFGMQSVDKLTLDRIEIRQVGQKEDGKLVDLALQLPTEMTLTGEDGIVAKITMKDATATALIEAQSGRGRESAIKITGARLDQPATGAWVSIGPLSMASKLILEPNDGWSGPVELAVTDIAYFVPQVPIGGEIKRIVFSGRSAGPRLDALNQLRDAVDALQADDSLSPEARGAAFLAMLPTIPTPFGSMSGDLAVDGLAVLSPGGEALMSLTSAAITTAITGLDGDAAAIRFTIRHEGLDLAPAILEEGNVPHRLAFDIGINDVSTQALGKLLRAASAIGKENGAAESKNQPKKQPALAELLGAAAMLNPVLRLYDVAIDTKDVGLDLTGEARGSPLAPKGYTAEGDLVFRGFDAIPKLGFQLPFAEYLPVLKEIGIEQAAPDGTARIDFHVVSAPPKWITINGNDVAAWFDQPESTPGQSRALKPSDPSMQGNDVRSVQRALAEAKIVTEQDGVYSPATAAAVARFQRQSGLNVTGVVDLATRQRLGLPADTTRQGGRN